MSRIDVARDMVQKIVEKKLNLFGHIRSMPDERLLKRGMGCLE